MNITGTHFNYYLICHRKLWLFIKKNKIMGQMSFKQNGFRKTNFLNFPISDFNID